MAAGAGCRRRRARRWSARRGRLGRRGRDRRTRVGRGDSRRRRAPALARARQARRGDPRRTPPLQDERSARARRGRRARRARACPRAHRRGDFGPRRGALHALGDERARPRRVGHGRRTGRTRTHGADDARGTGGQARQARRDALHARIADGGPAGRGDDPHVVAQSGETRADGRTRRVDAPASPRPRGRRTHRSSPRPFRRIAHRRRQGSLSSVARRSRRTPPSTPARTA